MLNIILSILGWFFTLWTKLPPEAKAATINAVADTFEAAFRAYYKAKKQEATA